MTNCHLLILGLKFAKINKKNMDIKDLENKIKEISKESEIS